MPKDVAQREGPPDSSLAGGPAQGCTNFGQETVPLWFLPVVVIRKRRSGGAPLGSAARSVPACGQHDEFENTLFSGRAGGGSTRAIAEPTRCSQTGVPTAVVIITRARATDSGKQGDKPLVALIGTRCSADLANWRHCDSG